MIATTELPTAQVRQRLGRVWRRFARPPRPTRPPDARSTPTPLVPPLSRRLRTIRAVLVMVCVITLSLLLELVVVSSLQQRATQQRAYDSFRADLAAGTAPVSAAELVGRVGAPVAYLEVPEIGLRQVVVEGTDSGSLYKGPGHRRDSTLPGYAGTSVVMARRTSFGGPFAEIDQLEAGDLIEVTTGAGVAEFSVRGVRRAGDVAPPPVERGRGRLVLATADGSALLASGAVLVDADLVGEPLGAIRPAVAPGALPASERAMGVDTSSLWRLLLWLQVLVATVLAAIWAWQRWHRAKAWIVFVPALLLVGSMTAGEAFLMLPNLV